MTDDKVEATAQENPHERKNKTQPTNRIEKWEKSGREKMTEYTKHVQDIIWIFVNNI